MIVDLITLGNSPFDFSFTIAPAELGLDDDDARLTEPAEVAGRVTKHIVQTDVEGTIRAAVEIECTRCLEKLAENLEIPFRAAYVAPEHYTEAPEAELREDDLDVSILEGNEIDLNELAREQILLNLPEQVFCREDCRGLCEKCGGNRNLINCNCLEEATDPRWAALKNLK
ncbi:MAG: DUF177 domain-containing protein [Acidobacteria bacterium]|nr:DUF177 domain-containing protein [Acidobacteriota bacterium]